jgi:nucleotide-binding universal stress UspA family protein
VTRRYDARARHPAAPAATENTMKVLVPLDDSEVSLAIMPTLQRMAASAADTEFHFMTVRDPDEVKERRMGEIMSDAPTIVGSVGPVIPEPLPKVVETRGQAIERVEEKLELWMKDIQGKNLPGANVAYHIDFEDDAADAIIARANNLDADVIAMATHARTGFRRAFVGSVTEKVIREGKRPVLVVAPPED